MRRIRKQFGFSLTEMLIATGIMSVGLVMVATVFPVGVKLTSLTTERSIGAVAADEAFAKIRLYGLTSWPVSISDPNTECCDFRFIADYDDGVNPVNSLEIGWNEFRYPSVASAPNEQQPYHWSALCRRIPGSDKEVQVTVFVTRKTSAGSFYGQDASRNLLTGQPWPSPVAVHVAYNASAKRQLTVTDAAARSFFGGGYTIVDNYSGTIYRVLEIKDMDQDKRPDTLVLMSDWQWRGYESNPLSPPASENATVWVVPPAVGSDRYPCVGVYQKVLRFD